MFPLRSLIHSGNVGMPFRQTSRADIIYLCCNFCYLSIYKHKKLISLCLEFLQNYKVNFIKSHIGKIQINMLI